MNYQTPNMAWVENEPLVQLKRECVYTGFKGVYVAEQLNPQCSNNSQKCTEQVTQSQVSLFLRYYGRGLL